MPQYLIYFNQQWVGDHDEAWFHSRVEPSTAVVRDMQDQGVLVYAGGLVEEERGAQAEQATGEYRRVAYLPGQDDALFVKLLPPLQITQAFHRDP